MSYFDFFADELLSSIYIWKTKLLSVWWVVGKISSCPPVLLVCLFILIFLLDIHFFDTVLFVNLCSVLGSYPKIFWNVQFPPRRFLFSDLTYMPLIYFHLDTLWKTDTYFSLLYRKMCIWSHQMRFFVFPVCTLSCRCMVIRGFSVLTNWSVDLLYANSMVY